MNKPKGLIIEDDREYGESLAALASREGFEVQLATTLVEAAALLADQAWHVVLLDKNLPDGDGLEFIADPERLGDAELIVITGDANFDSAVESLRHGALDYLTKPVDRGRLKTVLANVERTWELKTEVSGLRNELRQLGRFGHMIGRSPSIQLVFDAVARVAPTEASVLILGESGTGKEVVARTLHDLSRRKKGPLEAVNCGAIPETLIESELFGHERGSFTGADKMHRGFFERADGGTLFLDEITEMPTHLQVKLLRVLETGRVKRVGSDREIQVNVRVLAASNRDPHHAIESGRLRQDLYYRLAVFPITLPPLRDREEDVALLAEHFLGLLNEEYGVVKRWSAEALRLLEGMRWEGNVRELKNAVHRAFIMANEEITVSCIGTPVEGSSPPSASSDRVEVPIGSSISDAEKTLILATLESTDGDKRHASKILGISLKTLYTRLKLYEVAGQSLNSHK